MFLGALYPYKRTAPFLKQYHNFNRSSIFRLHMPPGRPLQGIMNIVPTPGVFSLCGCPPSPAFQLQGNRFNDEGVSSTRASGALPGNPFQDQYGIGFHAGDTPDVAPATGCRLPLYGVLSWRRDRITASGTNT